VKKETSMTRGEVIRKLIEAHDTGNGKKYETDDGRAVEWNQEYGPVIAGSPFMDTGRYYSNDRSAYVTRTYRETWKPRRWGPWEEVLTFGEAAWSGLYRVCVCIDGESEWFVRSRPKESIFLEKCVPVRWVG
jgi:hypothetical protein